MSASEFSDRTAPIKSALPWRLVDWDYGESDAIVGSDWDNGDDDERPICLLPPDSPHSELIKAAPQLLEACKAAIRATGGSKNWRGATAQFLKMCEDAVELVEGDAN